jgi:hypothetical protein
MNKYITYCCIGNNSPAYKKNSNKEKFFKRHLNPLTLEDISFIYRVFEEE